MRKSRREVTRKMSSNRGSHGYRRWIRRYSLSRCYWTEAIPRPGCVIAGDLDSNRSWPWPVFFCRGCQKVRHPSNCLAPLPDSDPEGKRGSLTASGCRGLRKL